MLRFFAGARAYVKVHWRHISRRYGGSGAREQSRAEHTRVGSGRRQRWDESDVHLYIYLTKVPMSLSLRAHTIGLVCIVRRLKTLSELLVSLPHGTIHAHHS